MTKNNSVSTIKMKLHWTCKLSCNEPQNHPKRSLSLPECVTAPCNTRTWWLNRRTCWWIKTCTCANLDSSWTFHDIWHTSLAYFEAWVAYRFHSGVWWGHWSWRSCARDLFEKWTTAMKSIVNIWIFCWCSWWAKWSDFTIFINTAGRHFTTNENENIL